MSLYRCLAWPLVRHVDAETAHRLTLKLLASGLLPSQLFSSPARRDDPVLAPRLFGRALSNPVGLAAGFDKNAEVPDVMLGFGFGFSEVGGVPPKQQTGHPRHSVVRVEGDRGG